MEEDQLNMSIFFKGVGS